ncbi:MAG: hypothetical protein UR95_C0003G0061 [Parcubacteria group bacterium GW2011_GWC1_36_108]|nr:MAG: hypothetical protein UR95_C0003G0061 [Parcubacteria group bacterium GW2011_GWC1_36_108]
METDPVVCEYNSNDEVLKELVSIFKEDLYNSGYIDKEGNIIGVGLQGEDFT